MDQQLRLALYPICFRNRRLHAGHARFPLLFFFVFSAVLSATADGPSRKPLRLFTVKDSIEASRILYNGDNKPEQLSPDGTRYLIVLYRGDLARNGTCVELLSGATTSLQRASDFREISLFSRSAARVFDMVRNVRWLGDNDIVFLWNDGKTPTRVVRINIRTGEMQTVVSWKTPISAYDISSDGRTLVFLAQSARNALEESRLEQTGFAITNQSLEALLNNNPDGWTPTEHYDAFAVSTSDARKPHKIRESPALWSIPPELLRISPNGRYAIAVEPARTVPKSWDDYTEHIFKDDYLPGARRDPNGSNFIRQYFLIDVRNATARPLWMAPENPFGKVVWSPDGQQVVIGPTFLPVSAAQPNGLAGRVVAVFNLSNSTFDVLPIPAGSSVSMYQPSHWTLNGVICLTRVVGQTHGAPTLDFENVDGRWLQVKDKSPIHRTQGSVHIEIREGPNSPPVIDAIEPKTGSERVVKALNPDLGSRVALARVEFVHWLALDGRSWSGMLYHPLHFTPGKSYPLVVQTHGYSRDRFSLTGSFPTAFAAQALANRDIAVLQVGGSDSGDADVLATPDEPRVFMSGIEGAIRHFVAQGMADPSRVGIIGFSRTGWLVEYMLTHSDFRFAAAEVADNIDGSYVQYVVGQDFLKSEYESDNGALPYGRGLQQWLQNAPGFNCDKIRTPLRLELDSGPIDRILGRWEIFSNLRRLGKPVELFVVPDVQNAAHILGTPAQQLASQGETVDWFCFWLNDEQDPSPTKTAQYVRWRRLRALQRKQELQQTNPGSGDWGRKGGRSNTSALPIRLTRRFRKRPSWRESPCCPPRRAAAWPDCCARPKSPAQSD